jgi:hypothetical protein
MREGFAEPKEGLGWIRSSDLSDLICGCVHGRAAGGPDVFHNQVRGDKV